MEMNASTALFGVSGVTGVGPAGPPGPQKSLCFVLGRTGRCDVIPGVEQGRGGDAYVVIASVEV